MWDEIVAAAAVVAVAAVVCLSATLLCLCTEQVLPFPSPIRVP